MTSFRTWKRLSLWPLWVVLALCVASCSDDEKASGNVVGPNLGPRVDESLLALGVLNGVPVGITTIFEQGEDVHLWVRWANLVPPHAVEAVWYAPNGTEVASAILDIVDGASNQTTDFLLELTPSSMIGRWEVFLYLDGFLQRSLVFDVLNAP